MVEAAFCGLKKLRKKGYQIDSCDLYGGEPLLKENMATVRAICEHAQAVPDAVLDDLPILDRQVFPLVLRHDRLLPARRGHMLDCNGSGRRRPPSWTSGWVADAASSGAPEARHTGRAKPHRVDWI